MCLSCAYAEESAHDPLNPGEVRALRPGAKPIDVRDGLARGLILTVLPSGKKTWSVRYRRDGRQRRLILGDFPGLSLAKARDAAEDARTKIRDGDDPAAELQARRRAPVDSFSKLSDAYLERVSDPKAREFKRSHEQDKRSLNVDVLPKWHDQSVKSISRDDVRALIDGIAKRGSGVMANQRPRARTSDVQLRARRGGGLDRRQSGGASRSEAARCSANACSPRTKSGSSGACSRICQRRRTGRRLAGRANVGARTTRCAPSARRSPRFRRIRLLTAQRGGEVALMKWADVDLETGWWTIPGADTKNGREHRIWLSADALAIVKAQASDDRETAYVFAGHDGEPATHRAKKASAALAKVLGFDFRGHDLRRTAATKMAAIGVARADIAKVLNHVEAEPRATRVYDRYNYDREKQTALETWARELARVVEVSRG